MYAAFVETLALERFPIPEMTVQGTFMSSTIMSFDKSYCNSY